MSSNSEFSQNQAFYMQYSSIPIQGHEEYIQQMTSPEPVPRPHINPNFRTKTGVMPSVHLNPRFHSVEAEGSARVAINPNFSATAPVAKQPSVHINPKFTGSPPVSPAKAAVAASSGGGVHINPKFAGRPLPSLPGQPNPAPIYSNVEPVYANISLSVSLDSRKTEDFVQSIQNSVQSQAQVIMRNKYKKDNRVKPPEKPIRNSIIDNRFSIVDKPNRYSVVDNATNLYSVVEKSNRHSVLEKPNRYSVVEKPNRYSVVETPNRYSVAGTLNPPTSSATPLTVPDTHCDTPLRKTEEKENFPSSVKKSFLFTPLRKSNFKKIGTRKLIRVKKKSLSPGTPKPSFKRIGNNKLIRIRESLTNDKSSPMKVYSIKTKTKIVKTVKNTPTNNSKYRFSFITPLSMRKNKLVSQVVKTSTEKKPSFANRFRLDRREKKDKEIIKRTSQTKLKKLGGSTYHVSATKLQKLPPVKPSRVRHVSIYRPKATVLNPNLAPNRTIMVQGVKFAVAENGRKLKRLTESEPPQSVSYSASVSHTSPGQSQTTSPSNQTSPGTGSSPAKLRPGFSPAQASPKQVNINKTYIGGEEFDEIEPGVFTRSRHSLTRQSITQAKNRSINTILKVQNRTKQYCMFFNKFGKCTKKEKGSCPYIHDPDKIAVCRRFLQGACTKENCLLSHKLDPEKMPACKFFLEGVCTRENCPYLHVKVSAKAGVCQRFLKGFCPNGADCGQRHVIACPEFDRTGACSREAKCPFPHILRPAQDSEAIGDAEKQRKKAPPAKPKRKSLGQPSDHNLKKSRVANRYYEEQANSDGGEEAELPGDENTGQDDLEEKRRRILKKLELAKKGWNNSIEKLPEDNLEASLNDSGPYDRIEEKRAPIGTLEDFISLSGYSSGEEKNDRLI